MSSKYPKLGGSQPATASLWSRVQATVAAMTPEEYAAQLAKVRANYAARKVGRRKPAKRLPLKPVWVPRDEGAR